MKQWLFILLILFALTGCRGNNESSNMNNTNDNDNPYMHVKNTTIENVDQEESEKISKHLANLAASVPNVKSSTAVALGNYAIVGIDVDENLDRSKVGSIKYSVSEVLKNDPHGANAIVVADPDITARLGEIGEDIRDGRPVQGVLNELSDIVGRIMPEIPGDLQDPTPKDATEDQKQDINSKDSQKLDKNQQEQSNNHKE
ncbi:YhcN/YlaJ family sporulation lipoprotein [Caldibacillus lycopersici]|uniref:YhcN/YlaJ family sporulation lipoprotein n=1 Tax=Perspicuibacillus lycopersici TaxID=1325689 RepID=A0AAE3IQA9_9BACI|nr:YhcN/YlaJ family sporulation lipoprotein [Perspicuibacillus lycopersici]MCU9612242.1 YhcN/YlaJ family sporulation lipoprotein [Perspicuibacillus lycopersici]